MKNLRSKKRSYKKQKTKAKRFEIGKKPAVKHQILLNPAHVSSMIKQFETGNVNIEELKTPKKLKKRLTD
jgi:hypothetical protein